MTVPPHKIKVGITMGDPSGIGPVIIAKALPKLEELADFVVIGDGWVFQKALNAQRTTHNAQRKLRNLGVIDLNNVEHRKFQFGKVRAEYGRASVEYLDAALRLIKAKEIDCLVTCPISKEAINAAGFRYSGHTEYFASKLNTRDPLMLLLNDKLKFALVTRHIALKEVPSRLSRRALGNTILQAYDCLKKCFLIREPRLVICGLNPHASDNGLLGSEEREVIIPALNELKRKFKAIDGPLSADIAIRRAYLKQYDCVVAMYHDQALIPLKLIGTESGVNLTFGLPFIRTSPLHGTAFDIACRPTLARPDSLIAAVKLAKKCASNLKKA